MIWDYIQLPDETQIAYSGLREDGTVLIGIERPRDRRLRDHVAQQRTFDIRARGTRP